MPVDKGRIAELNEVLAEKKSLAQEIGAAISVKDGKVEVTEGQAQAFRAAMADVKSIQGYLDDFRVLTEEKSDAGYESAASHWAALAAGGTNDYGQSAKSLGEMFLESPEYTSIKDGKHGFNSAPFEVKDIYSALPTGTPGTFGRTERDPMVTPPRRTRRVRSLFPVRNTTAAVIEYFRQTGFVNNASVVPERNADNTNFGLKPQSGLNFVGMQAPTRTIAHWEAAHRNVLADEPQLRAIIDNELLYGLQLVEDAQILLGNGVGENLLGILNSGIQDYNWSSGATTPVPDTKADAIRRAATLAYLAFYEPTGIVLHPNDYEDIELTKNTQGTYLFATSIQVGGDARMWRMPVIDTPAMPEGRALVGAFGTAAQLYDREDANIRVAEQHADFFIRNAIVILAEERLALAVKRPEAFVNVDFDAAPV